MNAKGLGRGLEALIPKQPASEPERTTTVPDTEIDVDKIVPNPNQPRTSFDEEKLKELVDSVRIHGILQPVLVRALDNGTYELVAGERRLRAAKDAGLKTIPAVIRDLTERQSLEMAIIENAQREDINIVDSAKAYKRLAEEFNMSQDMIASQIGKSRPSVANTMRLLKLPDEVIGYLASGELTEGRARPLLRLEKKEDMIRLARHIVKFKSTAREAEKMVKNVLENKEETPEKPKEVLLDPDTKRFVEDLAKRFGTKISVVRGGKKGGKVVLDYYDEEDLNRLLELLGGNND
ncbi:MAG: ParB/RepB/Spo0J family partition protein [Abditibacteriota bacterium]|nr:ParB/RepB/Spo0J family partition protein [Abditibacteriota bacterium]